MFNLERSITEWRQQMLAAGIKSSAVEELESHLREKIENQIKSRQNPQSAFDIAVKSIGRGVELKKEFKKAEESLLARLVKLMGIGCGTISFMFLVWVFQFLFYQTELTSKILGLMAVAISVLSWKYSHKFLPAIHQESTRAMIGFACCIAGVIWIQLFILKLLPGLMVHPPGMDMAKGRLVATILWAFTIMGVLSSVGNSLEKAARGHQAASS